MRFSGWFMPACPAPCPAHNNPWHPPTALLHPVTPGAKAVLAAQGPGWAPAGGDGSRRAAAPPVRRSRLSPRQLMRLCVLPTAAARWCSCTLPEEHLRRASQQGHMERRALRCLPGIPVPPLCSLARRYASSLDPSTITTFQMPAAAGQQQQQQGAQLGGLEPLELPDLRPRSAGCDASQHRAPGRRCSHSGSGLVSPPLYAALLQSPLAAPASSGEPPLCSVPLLSATLPACCVASPGCPAACPSECLQP